MQGDPQNENIAPSEEMPSCSKYESKNAEKAADSIVEESSPSIDKQNNESQKSEECVESGAECEEHSGHSGHALHIAHFFSSLWKGYH